MHSALIKYNMATVITHIQDKGINNKPNNRTIVYHIHPGIKLIGKHMQGQDPEQNIASNRNTHNNKVIASGKKKIVKGANNAMIVQSTKLIIELMANPIIEIGLPITKQLRTKTKHSNSVDVRSINIQQKVHTIDLVKAINKIKIVICNIHIGITPIVNDII